MAQFAKGKSGNPGGRPKGLKDKRTELRSLFQPHATKLIEQVVSLALKGDTTALRLCLDRICPPLKPQSEPVTTHAAGTLAERAEQIFVAATTGELTPDAAHDLMMLIQMQAKVEEVETMKAEIAEIKAMLQAAGHGENR